MLLWTMIQLFRNIKWSYYTSPIRNWRLFFDRLTSSISYTEVEALIAWISFLNAVICFAPVRSVFVGGIWLTFQLDSPTFVRSIHLAWYVDAWSKLTTCVIHEAGHSSRNGFVCTDKTASDSIFTTEYLQKQPERCLWKGVVPSGQPYTSVCRVCSSRVYSISRSNRNRHHLIVMGLKCRFL